MIKTNTHYPNTHYRICLEKPTRDAVKLIDKYFIAGADKNLCEYFAKFDKEYDGKSYNSFSLLTKIKIYHLHCTIDILNDLIK